MAFIRQNFNPMKQSSNGATPSLHGLYTAGKQTQERVQCGWNTKYLDSSNSQPHATSLRSALASSCGAQHANPSTQPKQVAMNIDGGSSESQSSDMYFMAGDYRCPYTRKAMQVHKDQSVNVSELLCERPENAQHPVCLENRAQKRGVPSYYKQDSSGRVQYIRSGFSTDMSFLK